MLRRRGRIHCFCARLAVENTWLFFSALILCLTVVDLYFHEVENSSQEAFPMDSGQATTVELPPLSSVLMESPILPQFNSYPEEMREILTQVYNTSFKEVAKAKVGIGKSPLIPGKNHVRLILVSTWRSGSSFLSELLASHPGAFLQTEPLNVLGVRRIFSEYDWKAQDALKIVANIIKCNNSALKEHVKPSEWPHIYWFHHEQNKLFHTLCSSRKLLQQNKIICGDLTYLDGVCNALPIQIAKLVRVNLKVISAILGDESVKENLKLLLLARDPRAVINSRKKFPWCITTPDCIEAKNLCKDMVTDYNEAKRLIDQEPNHFRVVRYEDLVRHIWKHSREIFEFMGLELQQSTHDFIYQALHPDLEIEEGSMKRSKPSSAMSRWMDEMDYTEIANIQRDCKEAMQLWGYAFVKSPKELSNIDPVGKYALERLLLEAV